MIPSIRLIKLVVLAGVVILSVLYLEGQEAELKVPAGLPSIPWPEDNLYTPQKADLGRLLFFDKRLSTDGSVSCASCHRIPCAFGDSTPVSDGIHGRPGNRNSPTLVNTAYSKFQFWDGRAKTLEDQVKGPLGNHSEMTEEDNPQKALELCTEKVRQISEYKPLFKAVFGHEDCTIDDIAKAIATFERTILSGNSPFDRYQLGDKTALSSEQIKGYETFKRVGCINCHSGPNFTNGGFANIGIGMNQPHPEDTGRFEITGQMKDWGSFKIPTLREVTLTRPYMHDGVYMMGLTLQKQAFSYTETSELSFVNIRFA